MARQQGFGTRRTPVDRGNACAQRTANITQLKRAFVGNIALQKEHEHIPQPVLRQLSRITLLLCRQEAYMTSTINEFLHQLQLKCLKMNTTRTWYKCWFIKPKNFENFIYQVKSAHEYKFVKIFFDFTKQNTHKYPISKKFTLCYGGWGGEKEYCKSTGTPGFMEYVRKSQKEVAVFDFFFLEKILRTRFVH